MERMTGGQDAQSFSGVGLSVVAMGWSWAVYCIQLGRSYMLAPALSTPSGWICDKEPVPTIGPTDDKYGKSRPASTVIGGLANSVSALYIDSFKTFSWCEELSKSTIDRMLKVLAGHREHLLL